MPEWLDKDFDEAEQIIRLFVDHYRSRRITINDEIARVTIERAYKFLAGTYESEERKISEKLSPIRRKAIAQQATPSRWKGKITTKD